MSNTKYKKFTQIEHVLNKPSMYIGGIEFIKSKQFIYDKNKIIEKEIDYNPGLYKICDELIVNVYDQTLRDKTVNNIIATINNNSFSIFNSGIGIPIEKHKEYKIYIPELIFGNLLTSSNYDINEERIYGGTFGIGSKATNIFSKKFTVEVWYKNKYYKQVFENNLDIIGKPIIENDNKIKGGVKITIEPDFNKFSCDGFSSDMQNLIIRRLIDLTILVKQNINITINKINYNLNFEQYLNLYGNNWIIGNCIKNNLWNIAIKINDKNIDTNHHITFVNGIFTNNGGSHVDYIFDLLLIKFQKLINPNITKRFLKDNLILCLVTSIINPTFNSQTKETLIMPINKFGFECNISNNLFDSNLVDELKNIYSRQDLKLLSKLETSKKNKIKGIPKLEDANYAGTKKSNLCTLILTEGDSAKATAISGISAIKNGRDIFGIYPLRGKLLNVREATTKQITQNEEIIDIKKILALKSGVEYTSNNIDELRYGSIMLMMDADEDGSHIKGLIINFLNFYFPSLLKIKGFLKILVTPIVKVFLRDNKIHSFPNLREYNNWLTKHPGNYKTKYYKGLGTSTREEAKEYFHNLDKNIITIYDNKNEKDILLAFSKNTIIERKKWLINYDINNILQLTPPMNITIYDFIHKELIHFSNYDNLRSIPLLIDGLKPSQRKVLYASFKKNIKNEIKVAQLASYTAEITAYHHGEQSLVGTIINMAQNYVGSNNFNLLVPLGQMGTRLLGGKDHASARYIFTQLNPKIDLIYKKDDFNILNYLQDDGEKIEPQFYLPIIPIILINGSEGIGTGFSTYIPCYDLNDILKWFINKLNGKNNYNLIPKYNNFKGTIIKYDDNTFLSVGVLTFDKDKIIITELPIKMWTSIYKEYLDVLLEEGKIKNYINHCSDTEIYFEIKISDIEYFTTLYKTTDQNNLNQLYKFFNLYKTIKISNLTLYDENFKLKTYNSVEDICNAFYKMRLPFYEKRKEFLLLEIKNEIITLDNQIKFINIVKTNTNIFNLSEDKIIDILNKNKLINHDLLLSMNFKQLTQNNLDKLTNKIKELKIKKTKLDYTTDKELWLNDLKQCIF